MRWTRRWRPTITTLAAGCAAAVLVAACDSGREGLEPAPPPSAGAQVPAERDSTIVGPTGATTSSTTSPSTTSSSATVPPAVGGFSCVPFGSTPGIWDVRPASDLASPQLPEGWTTQAIGTSVQRRPIETFVRAVESPRRRVLVIGGIHGNEPVTPPVVRSLVDAEIGGDIELWLVPLANPDGSAAGLRCNARGVDLNRNFSWDWRAEDGGPAALSEPETAALTSLVDALRPDLVVWVHQPLDYVASIGPTDQALAAAWSGPSGLPARPGVTQHGGGESWTAFVAGLPSMLIEIDGWAATPAIVEAQRAGFEATMRALD